ncbi:peptidoglycan editing factor PgeF [Moraxella boevrei]|uniref:peptidoglycan editing factor PgeF n=1 Tax=Faucicola boevrei TaxID=346665 RepID=UPI003736A556
MFTNSHILPLTTSDNPIQVVQTFSQMPSSATNLYGDFNLGLHVLDSPTSVHQHRMDLLSELQQHYPSVNQIHWLSQVHGNLVHHATQPHACPISADAHITDRPNVALAIMTADCVPIMLADGAGNLGAIHAGWQGLAKSIIAETINYMNRQGAYQAPTRVYQAWIGACIAQANYEVDDNVKTQVLASLARLSITVDDALSQSLFTPTRHGHYLANLAKVAELQLQACGVQQIYQSGLDSYSDPRFYSYRQQSQQKSVATGRMATLIFCTD